eukprot:Seg471.3 transcript_id=Seg471.3/GoldUCD/mRNA.D3Y31 product="Lipopolysaccharide-induced tumor necrosis factor-alpha factor" protein_id=Seg471.3/GoldUCD/D3Y31
MTTAPPPYSGPDAGAYPPGEPAKVAPGAGAVQQPGYGATQPGYPPAGGAPGYPPAGGAPGYSPAGGAPGYPAQSGPTTTTVVMQQPVVVQRMVMGQYPVLITCPQCHAQVTTSVTYQNGLMVWLMVGGMLLVG